LNRAGIIKLTVLAAVTGLLWTQSAVLALLLGAVGLFALKKEVVALGGESLRNDTGALGAGLAVLLLLSFCVVNPPGAGDDVLRDIASAAYHYDYSKMYPNADIQHYNAYIGFDWLLAHLVTLAGPQGALHIVQALAGVSFLAFFVLFARQTTGKLHPEHYALIGLAFATPLASRLFLARPEVFFTVWGLYAALVTTRLRLAAWLLVGAVLTTGYWLAALYFPFALLMTARFRTKVLVGLLLLAWNFIFWHIASHGTYLQSLGLLSSWPKHRVMAITETGSCFQLLLNPEFLALTLLAGVSCTSRKLTKLDCAVLVLIGYFLMSGMIRYVAVWAALLVLLALPLVHVRRVENLWLRAGLLFFPFYCASATYASALPMTRLPSFTFPKNAYVLTAMDVATFAVPFFNPGTVSVAPSMELGANTLPVQNLAADLSRGKLDCTKLKAQPFTHVVEDYLSTLPPCLKLVGVKGSWREWEVVR
jgi:hypothetical protein